MWSPVDMALTITSCTVSIRCNCSRLIIEVVEQVHGLDDAPELGESPGKARRAVVGL
jgi:hypothetical protein